MGGQYKLAGAMIACLLTDRALGAGDGQFESIDLQLHKRWEHQCIRGVTGQRAIGGLWYRILSFESFERLREVSDVK
jgi:hypothetical protein